MSRVREMLARVSGVDQSSPPGLRRVTGYLLALVYAAAAAFITLSLGTVMDRNVFLFFFVAVCAAALAHGVGPGLLALTATIIALDWWFFAPVGLGIAVPVERVRLGVYALIAFVILVLSELLRRTRRQAAAREQALADSERRYRMVLEEAADAILISDADGLYLEVNDRAVALTGYPREKLVGMRAPDLMTPESVEHLPLRLGELSPGRRLQQEREIVRADGSRVPVEIHAAMLDDGRVLAIARDLRGRRHLEDQLRHSQKMEAIGRLAGGLAHDLNNILTVITTYSELMLASEPGEWNREDVTEISKAAGRASALTRQLLTFSRKQMLRAEILDVDAIISESERMLRAVIGPEIALEIVTASMPWRARADRGQLEQVLVNLAVNARDAMPDGGRLRIATGRRLVEDTTDDGIPRGEYVTLTVADNGIGMDTDTLAHLFEPFFTTKPSGRGTGLGLATVYGIVTQSEGLVRVRSSPGQGATFTVLLPRMRRVSPSPLKEGATPDAALDEPATILIVDDEPAVLAVTERILAARGHRVLTASGGSEALQQSRQWTGRIDLLLSDLRMPVMDGRELAERLVAERPDTSVVFMSGFSEDPVIRAEVRESRATLVSKPFAASDLMNAISRTLRKARAKHAASAADAATSAPTAAGR